MYLSIDAGRRPVEGDARILPSRLHARGQALRLHRLVARRARLGADPGPASAPPSPARAPTGLALRASTSLTEIGQGGASPSGEPEMPRDRTIAGQKMPEGAAREFYQ